MPKGRNILAATFALVATLPVESHRQRSVSPIVVPFERAPSPHIVIRVPVTRGPCEALIFDTGISGYAFTFG